MQRKHISLFLLFCFFCAVVAFSGLHRDAHAERHTPIESIGTDRQSDVNCH